VGPNTVFGHLAFQFATHPENLATEALSFVLRTSPAASRAFTEFLRPIGLDCPGGLYFETQRGGLEQSIPDMKCRDGKGQLRVIVENKFWAGLTENQPVTYIQELFHQLPVGVAALLFVVPKARLQLVWDEVVRRCGANEVPVGNAQKLASMTAASLGEGHYIAVTSWGALLDALFTAATSAGEIGPCNDIAQLQGLCRRMDETAFLPVSGDELTNLGMARRIIDFSDLPFAIVEKSVKLGLCIKRKESNFRYGSGTYIRICGFNAWVGFSANLWRNLGVSPIWVNFYPESCATVQVREDLVRFRTAAPQRCFDADIKNYRWVAVPIFLPTGVEKPHIIEEAVRQIGELKDELGLRGPLAAAADPTLTDDLDKEPEHHPESEANE
jgi:hypothetical protein